METPASIFLASAIKRLAYYKDLGDKTFAQLADADFFFRPDAVSNSIAVVIRHMSGNMLSRWTNFLTEDGEKEWRSRDEEFETVVGTRAALLLSWQKGWDCMFTALDALTPDDLVKNIYIRTQALTVVDAINRQLAHYPYHVGQIVYLGKMIRKELWQSLSIPPGQSTAYNEALAQKK